MNVSRIAISTSHQKWCKDFLAEQNKTTKLVRRILEKSSTQNPFSYNRKIVNILKRYEKSFWG